MTRRTEHGDRAFSTVRDRFRQWREEHPAQPAEPSHHGGGMYLPIPELSDETGRVVFTAIGVGIGVVLLVLAVTAFFAVASWAQVGRDGASTGYTLVGLFLTVAGTGAIIASWNHNYRVMLREQRHHH